MLLNLVLKCYSDICNSWKIAMALVQGVLDLGQLVSHHLSPTTTTTTTTTVGEFDKKLHFFVLES